MFCYLKMLSLSALSVTVCGYADLRLATKVLQMNQHLVSIEFNKFSCYNSADVLNLASALSEMTTIYNLKFSNCFNAAFFPIENLLFSELKYRKSRIQHLSFDGTNFGKFDNTNETSSFYNKGLITKKLTIQNKCLQTFTNSSPP